MTEEGFDLLREKHVLERDPDGLYWLSEDFTRAVRELIESFSEEEMKNFERMPYRERRGKILMLSFVRHASMVTKDEIIAATSILDAFAEATDQTRLEEWSMLLRLR